MSVLTPGLTNVMIAVGIGSVPVYARLMRGQVLSLKRREYVESARASGARAGRIIFRHILPNSLSPLIVLASLGIAGAILTGAALSFIGMGAQPPSPEWGAMLRRAGLPAARVVDRDVPWAGVGGHGVRVQPAR